MLYLFQLGQNPDLSITEIKSVLNQHQIKIKNHYVNDNFLIIKLNKTLDCQKLLNQLGGTIKIAKAIDYKNNLEKFLVNYLQQQFKNKKIIFAINNKKIALKLKKILKQQNLSVRFVKINNSATIIHNNLIQTKSDFTFLNNKLFISQSIQNIEDFSFRDYSRPAADSTSGMLPPKLARILINLHTNKAKNIFDPFCGSGTILMEAALLGFKKIFGSDLSPKAIKDSQKNLTWLKQKYNLKFNFQLQTHDNNKKFLNLKNIDLIVTEPYLGKPLKGTEKIIFLQKQITDLYNLYFLTLKNLKPILNKNAEIIFIIPRFRFKNKWLIIDFQNILKKLNFKTKPFNSQNKTLIYWRPQQHLGREIWRFTINY